MEALNALRYFRHGRWMSRDYPWHMYNLSGQNLNVYVTMDSNSWTIDRERKMRSTEHQNMNNTQLN
jgi:hypothetical protein